MNGAVAELVDAGDSKSPGVISLRVRVSPALPWLGDCVMEFLVKEKVVYKKNNFLKEKISKDHFTPVNYS